MDIEHRARLTETPARETALACVEAGIEAARPERALREQVTLDGDRLRVGEEAYDLDAFDDVIVLGGGKAAVGVATLFYDVFGDRVSGAVVAPDSRRRDGDDRSDTENADGTIGAITVLAGDHPVPTERGVRSTKRVLELAHEADERTLVLAVVTGGASALLAAPADGISLADLQGGTEELLASGAAIDEINAVRKHCSAIKGGLLARRAAPATVVGLLLSDVVGDSHTTIGSGPTAPDETTFADALRVLDRYEIDAPAVRDRLARGVDGEIEETPRESEPLFERVSNQVLANAGTALDAARTVAEERGYSTLLLSSTLRGEAREVGTIHAAMAEECLATGNPIAPPAVMLSGGEGTVTVRGEGTGGPNLEVTTSGAIAFAHDEFGERVALCSVDTDGRDGATNAAGAVVDGTTISPADREQARDALDENDVLAFLDGRDALVRTGETGTNVNDLRVLVVEDGERSE